MVFKPNENLPTTYKAVVSGDTDMVVNSNFDTTNGKSVNIAFVAYKGNVRYQDMVLKTKATAAVGDFYVIVRNNSGTEMTLEGGTNSVIFPIAKVEGSKITKAVPGNYSFVVYQKASTGTDAPKASGSFTVKDSQEGATFEQTSATTIFPLSTSTSQSTADSILAQCFNLSFNGTAATGKVTNYIAGKDYIFIRTIAVTGTISVGGNTYTIEVPLEINKVVQYKIF